MNSLKLLTFIPALISIFSKVEAEVDEVGDEVWITIRMKKEDARKLEELLKVAL